MLYNDVRVYDFTDNYRNYNLIGYKLKLKFE